jgi:hypothetical protein
MYGKIEQKFATFFLPLFGSGLLSSRKDPDQHFSIRSKLPSIHNTDVPQIFLVSFCCLYLFLSCNQLLYSFPSLLQNKKIIQLKAVLRIWIRWIRMFLGLLDPDPDPLLSKTLIPTVL